MSMLAESTFSHLRISFSDSTWILQMITILIHKFDDACGGPVPSAQSNAESFARFAVCDWNSFANDSPSTSLVRQLRRTCGSVRSRYMPPRPATRVPMLSVVAALLVFLLLLDSRRYPYTCILVLPRRQQLVPCPSDFSNLPRENRSLHGFERRHLSSAPSSLRSCSPNRSRASRLIGCRSVRVF